MNLIWNFQKKCEEIYFLFQISLEEGVFREPKDKKKWVIAVFFFRIDNGTRV